MIRSGFSMRVFKPVLHPDRDEGRFIFLEDQILIAPHHGRFARDDNPVLGALMMILQRQGRAGIDLDQFDLGAGTEMQRLEKPPWTVDPRVLGRFGAAGLVQSIDHQLHILVAITVRHQNGIVGCHNDQVLNPDGGQEPTLAADEIVSPVLDEDVPRDDIARCVFRAALPEHRPRSHIAPADIGGDDAGFFVRSMTA